MAVKSTAPSHARGPTRELVRPPRAAAHRGAAEPRAIPSIVFHLTLHPWPALEAGPVHSIPWHAIAAASAGLLLVAPGRGGVVIAARAALVALQGPILSIPVGTVGAVGVNGTALSSTASGTIPIGVAGLPLGTLAAMIGLGFLGLGAGGGDAGRKGREGKQHPGWAHANLLGPGVRAGPT